jgi:hypothetical protein
VNTVEFWLSRLLVVALVGLTAVLTVTVPQTTDETITLDIHCVSGNPVVGVWIDAAEGGSGWAVRGAGESQFIRFTHELPFGGAYSVHVGCGGSANRWGVAVWSTEAALLFRRLTCDDIAVTPPTPGQCTDETK